MALTTSPDTHYDVIVVGGGTAGSNAARAAHQAGAKTLMVRKSQWWNLCVQRGCMPSKSMLSIADAVLDCYDARDQKALSACDVQANYAETMRRKDRHVDRFERALEDKLSEEPYDIAIGTARFQDTHTLVLMDTDGRQHTMTADRFVLATGTEPFVPDIDGIPDVPHVTSDDVMEGRVPEAPSRVLVLGGGAIGLEMATFYAGMGSEVTLVDRKPLMAHLGERYATSLRGYFEEQGVRVITQSRITEFTSEGYGLQATLDGSTDTKQLSADLLLVATGRRPQWESINAAALGIATDAPAVHETSLQAGDAPHVYIAGDANGKQQLLHVASEEGTVAGQNAARGKPVAHVDRTKLSMSVVFTNPPVAHVGLTEPEAHTQGLLVAHRHLPETGRAITMGVTYGWWTLIADPYSGEIRGSTIHGPHADELIHQPFLAMQLGGTVQDIDRLYAYHPTISEQFTALASELADHVRSA